MVVGRMQAQSLANVYLVIAVFFLNPGSCFCTGGGGACEEGAFKISA